MADSHSYIILLQHRAIIFYSNSRK